MHAVPPCLECIDWFAIVFFIRKMGILVIFIRVVLVTHRLHSRYLSSLGEFIAHISSPCCQIREISSLHGDLLIDRFLDTFFCRLYALVT